MVPDGHRWLGSTQAMAIVDVVEGRVEAFASQRPNDGHGDGEAQRQEQSINILLRACPSPSLSSSPRSTPSPFQPSLTLLDLIDTPLALRRLYSSINQPFLRHTVLACCIACCTSCHQLLDTSPPTNGILNTNMVGQHCTKSHRPRAKAFYFVEVSHATMLPSNGTALTTSASTPQSHHHVLLRQLQIRLQRLEVGQLPPALSTGISNRRDLRHEDGLSDAPAGRKVLHVRED